MRQRALRLAAVIPLATAGAGESLHDRIDVRELRKDIHATEMLDADVMLGGEDAGDVEDLLVAADGSIRAVLVEDLDDGNGLRQQPVDVPQDGAVTDGATDDDGVARIAWDAVSYDRAEESVTLNFDDMPETQPAAGNDETFLASDLIGMDVDLADADSFGEIEDLLIDEGQGKVSAVVVDTWQGFDKRTYALSVELGDVNREEGNLAYPYTESDVTSLQEYRKR